MNAHKGLTRLDVLKYPPAKIGLMVASEFLRASNKTQYPEIVQKCFARARELMGVLEVADLDPECALYLQAYYRRCTDAQIAAVEQWPSVRLHDFCIELATVFEVAFDPKTRPIHA